MPIAMLCLALWAQAAPAKNVDLATLPGRQSVQLTIYNSEDLTLVKETRYITVKRGLNRLQFSWANTLIDPTSVELRPLEMADRIEIADTVFSGQKRGSLIWNVNSRYEGQVKVEISYFTSGLTWQMDYVATANPEETRMRFRGYVRVFNKSGEEYENAEVRLIVGTINLVEKIAELARRYGQPVPPPASRAFDRYRKKAARGAFRRAEAAAAPSPTPPGRPRPTPKQVVKEGLSEYFLFRVEGTETIRNGWSKRMIAVKAEEVKFDILYRLRAYQYGPRPVRFFLWRNDTEHKLGESPLPNGLVRIFRENGRDGLSYLGEKILRYVPIKARIEVNLGPDDLVVFEMIRRDTRRYNFSQNRHGHVDGWDERQEWDGLVRNYRGKPIRFELRLQYGGDVDFESEITTRAFDYRTVEATFSVDGRGKTGYPCTVIIHHGRNHKQNRVNLKD
jgi:hypothetical protein